MPKRDLELHSPWMNATGMLGFAPNPRGQVALDKLGAFVTNPVSLRPRAPAQNRALLPFPGGFLLHTGWPNPGLRAVLRRSAEAKSGATVWTTEPLRLGPSPSSAQQRAEEPAGAIDSASYASPLLFTLGGRRQIAACSLRHVFGVDPDDVDPGDVHVDVVRHALAVHLGPEQSCNRKSRILLIHST